MQGKALLLPMNDKNHVILRRNNEKSQPQLTGILRFAQNDIFFLLRHRLCVFTELRLDGAF